MKKHYYLIILLLASFLSIHRVQAQNVNIPDATFKAGLVANTDINTSGDGEIQTAEAEAYTGTIVGGLGISNLTGVEAFINATGFDCEFNNVSTIDLTHNTKLTNIRISDCQVTSLDLSLNSLLNYFYCYNCPLVSINIPANTTFAFFLCQKTLITSLDVSQNIAFAFFNCGLNSKLASLNIKNGHNTQFTNFYALGNPLLTCIQVDDPAYMDANWGTKKDVTTSYNAICSGNAINVNIPDANFLAALVANPDINTDGDGAIQVSEAAAFAGTLDVSNQSISDLMGIEAFTGITALYCNYNQITSLDASACTNLQNLQCRGNQLINLNIPSNNVLDYLDCSDNQIPALNVSANTGLTQLYCSNNKIASLNVSNCGQLVNLSCGQNKIINTIDLSNNLLLIGLACYTNQLTTLNVSNNPLLQTLDCSQNQISTLVLSSNAQLVSLACSDNLLTDLIVSSNPLLTSLTCGFNPLSNLDLTQNPALSYLEFSNTSIPDIDLHANANLTFVACTQGHLISLDVSSCPLLTNLNCQANAITILNLSANPLLQNLTCHTNQLTNLDLSANQQLTSLGCENNPLLTTVNIKNGNNSNLTGLDLINNPSLSCIQVDNVVNANNYSGWSKDINAGYSENCTPSTPAAALNFAGVDNYLSINNTIGNFGTGDFAVETMLKTTSTELQYLFSKRSNCGHDNFWSIDITTAGKMQIELDESGSNYLSLTGTTSVNDGQWHHLALTRVSGVVTIYVDGVVQNSGISSANLNNIYPLELGSSVCNGFPTNLSIKFSGDLDEVRIWDVGRTQAEIQNSMNCEIPSGTSGLLANYHFNQGIAAADNAGETTLLDASGNGNNGMLNNFALNGSSSNWVVQGGVVSGNTCIATPCFVNIPDANFKAYLLNPINGINTNNDGEIQCAEAAVYTRAIDVGNLGINDLTGIEAFTGISALYCGNNSLTSLNVSANTQLTTLSCFNNHLNSLDISFNTALLELVCGSNTISNLDVSQNTSLKIFDCSYNNLSILDVTNNTALTNLGCVHNALISIDITQNAQLDTFNFADNDITSLNLSANSLLKFLNGFNNQLNTLDISNLSVLSYLNCSKNNLYTLDLSGNPALNFLRCHTNNFNTLDVSSNTALMSFVCYNNATLSSLNIKNGANASLSFFDARNNPSLTCIQVDDVADANGYSGWSKDATSSFSTYCGTCPVYFASLGLATGSASAVCAGSSTNLAVNITGGNSTNTYFDITYQYGIDYVTSRVFATGSNVSLPVSVAPTSTITYKLLSVIDANGCEGLIGPSNADTFEIVTVNPLPTISANLLSTTNLCPGTLVKLTSSRSSTGYLWNNGKITRTINVYTDGNYSVAGNGCTSAPVTVSYLPCNAPTGISIVSNTGTTATVNFAQISCGQSYELRYKLKAGGTWTKITGITSSPYTISGLTPNTGYKMQMRTVCNRNQLKFSDWTIVYVFKTAAVFTSNQSSQLLLNEPQSSFTISVTPNPVSIITTLAIKGTTKPVTISITDMAGKVLMTYHNITDRQYKIPVGNLAKGMYLVTVTDEAYTQTLKLVKE